MMTGESVKGIGVDLAMIPRMRKVIERWDDRFLRRVFTEEEIAYCQRRRDPVPHLAARFAAKEAVMKALSQLDPGRVLAMNQIEVRNDRWGRPHILLHDGRHRRVKVHVSLSHVDTVAVASAIAVQ